MPMIKPFKALHYNPEKIKDLDQVVCPPYDVISPEDQERYLAASPYNYCHITLGKDQPNDNAENNKYTRARKYLEDWMKKGVLVQDDKPALYFYKQEYKILGQKHSRMGFISLMELKDEGESKVYPHENTHAKAVDDRLKLWSTMGANCSCIFVCFSDRQRKVESIFAKNVSVQKPLFDVIDPEGVHHRLWRLDDEILINEINESLKDSQLFIADGHHRYKVANEYRRMRMDRRKTSSGQEPFNYVMTYFTNIDSKELQIFPIHRVVKRMPKNLDFSEEYFRADKIKQKADLLIFLARAGLNEHAFGLYTRDSIRLLRLKNKSLIDEQVKEGSFEYKRLDAAILKYFIFDKLGIKSDDIIYTKDYEEAISLVDSGQADASFILNPVRISQLKAIALNGERMPPKTTYFYPKVLSGLTIYKME